MDATDQNIRLAGEIQMMLAREHCTVSQALAILAYVWKQIKTESTVQSKQNNSELNKDTRGNVEKKKDKKIDWYGFGITIALALNLLLQILIACYNFSRFG